MAAPPPVRLPTAEAWTLAAHTVPEPPLPHPHPRHHRLPRVAGEQQQQHADEHLDASEPPTTLAIACEPIEFSMFEWL